MEEVDSQPNNELDLNPSAIEIILDFGRDLQALYSRLTSNQVNEQLQFLLQVRFYTQLLLTTFVFDFRTHLVF